MSDDGPGSAASQRVDFYVLDTAEPRARLLLACRLVEKAYLAGQRVFVWLEDAAALAAFDELLWTFSDRSFVPHEGAGAQEVPPWGQCPVLLGCQSAPAPGYDLLLNLGGEAPAASLEQAPRIIEILDTEPARRQAARERYRRYRERGVNPQTHHIAADESG
ncbi:MAG TPA: DNA polymerase III subunit chi [Steroidobacteraceae bacterium]|nr:DNA polymerase III subunit chi [Steroidobacteraceae bacterium]